MLDLLFMAGVFIFSFVVGYLLISKVPTRLHTPLMSLTNAISAIAVVGSIVLAGRETMDFPKILGTIAVVASMTNIVSGFLLTDRMLKMFKKREPSKS